MTQQRRVTWEHDELVFLAKGETQRHAERLALSDHQAAIQLQPVLPHQTVDAVRKARKRPEYPELLAEEQKWLERD